MKKRRWCALDLNMERRFAGTDKSPELWQLPFMTATPLFIVIMPCPKPVLILQQNCAKIYGYLVRQGKKVLQQLSRTLGHVRIYKRNLQTQFDHQDSRWNSPCYNCKSTAAGITTNNADLGSGCGSVGRVVASDASGPRFKSSHRQKIKLIIYCQLY